MIAPVCTAVAWTATNPVAPVIVIPLPPVARERTAVVLSGNDLNYRSAVKLMIFTGDPAIFS